MSGNIPDVSTAEKIRKLIAMQQSVSHLSSPAPRVEVKDKFDEDWKRAKPFVKPKVIPVMVPQNNRELSSRMAGSTTQDAQRAMRTNNYSIAANPDVKTLMDMINTLQQKVAKLEQEAK